MSADLATGLPILWSFRRCPYAMRARLALHASGTAVEHREILLRNKPAEMLTHSPKGTVPVLVLEDGRVIEESRDVMMWALGQADPESWLAPGEAMFEWIDENDGPFKHHLDRFKYSVRYEDADPELHRREGAKFLARLDARLRQSPQLFGERMSLADAAIFPFVRQFANADRDWFDAQDYPALSAWLEAHLTSQRFTEIMTKHPLWEADADRDADTDAGTGAA